MFHARGKAPIHVTVIGDAAPPSGDGWIHGNWQYASTHEGCDLQGDRLIEVTYQAGVYTVRTIGRGVDAQADANGDVTCTSTSGSVTLDLRGYPPPGGFGPDDFLRMFHCGEHLGQDREACDLFVFTEFSDERIEIEATVGSVLSTYTTTPAASTLTGSATSMLSLHSTPARPTDGRIRCRRGACDFTSQLRSTKLVSHRATVAPDKGAFRRGILSAGRG